MNLAMHGKIRQANHWDQKKNEDRNIARTVFNKQLERVA